MTRNTSLHLHWLSLDHPVHAADVAVAIGACHAGLDVGVVREPDMVWHAPHAHPIDSLLLDPGILQRLRGRLLRCADDHVAIHTFLRRGQPGHDIGRRALVTERTLQAQLLDVHLVIERDWLLRGWSGLVGQQSRRTDADEEDAAHKHGRGEGYQRQAHPAPLPDHPHRQRWMRDAGVQREPRLHRRTEQPADQRAKQPASGREQKSAEPTHLLLGPSDERPRVVVLDERHGQLDDVPGRVDCQTSGGKEKDKQRPP